MAILASQSAGGRATAKINRAQALARYQANPRYCRQCGLEIQVRPSEKPGETRRKIFCTHRCAAIYNNKGRIPIPRGQVRLICNLCNEPFLFHKKRSGPIKRKYCARCFTKAILKSLGRKAIDGDRTKGELFSSRSNWQSARTTIRHHACKAYAATGRPLACLVCGYSKYIEICHRRSVASFNASATLSEINDPTNLLALCPNHHWEFDHGHLPLES